jgi:ATP-dependent helicase/DNAse subunit B
MLRSWDSGHADALRQALAWYGISAEFSRGPALASVPAVQAALDVLDVVSGRWRRQDVLKLLGSNYVQCLPGDGVQIKPRQFEKLTLEAGIIGGADASNPSADWADAFARLGTRLQSERTQRQQLDSDFNISSNPEWSEQTQEDDEGNRLRPLTTIEALIGYVEQCSTVVGGLRELLQPLSDAESMADAAKAFSDILKNLDIVGAVDSADVGQAAKDQQALTQLSELLAEIAEAPVAPPESSDAPAEAEATAATTLPTEFAYLVRRACSETRLQIAGRRGVGVQVLDMTEAGFEQFEVLFICGMRDGLLPRRGPADVFYPDADRASLQQENPGLRPRSGQIHDDKQLLHAALSAARKQVWLTYPLTEADGSPVLRSPYVDEVLRHWEESGEPPSELVHTRRQSQVIEQLKGACHYLEALEAVQAHPPRLQDTQIQEALNELASSASSGALPEPAQICELSQIGRQRADAPENSAFAGIISNAAITADLATIYGQEYIFSASSLNSYAACPMQFYFRYVLGLEGLEEPTDDVDIRDLGLLAHRILSEFYGQRTIGTDNDAPLNAENLPTACEQLDDVIDDIAGSWVQTVFGAPDVWEMAIERMRQDLHAVLEYDAEKNSATGGTGAQLPPRRVRAVEARYGQNGGLPIYTNETTGSIRVQGRIDRIDLAEEDDNSKWWVLWDYKSGDGPAKKLVTSGVDVQLPLYAMAVQDVYPDEAYGFRLWGYWRVRRPVGWGNSLLRYSRNKVTTLLEDTITQAGQMIGQHASGVRSGKFPPEPHDSVKPCRYCDFGDICGNRKSRK